MSRNPVRARAARLWKGIERAGSRAADGLAADAWPLLQGAAAATVAWLIARDVLGNDEPFFAPIAAVVALNAPRGERGLNAVRLLVGVIVGILSGELTVALLGEGYARLAVAILLAVIAARAFGSARIVIAQAASSAILTVVTAEGEAGVNRLVDALTGAGVALAFSQLLFSPDPVRLVRRAQSAVLARMAAGLRLTARALESDDDELADRATNSLRLLYDRLAELARVRKASTRVVRHSLIWRSRMAPVVRENENADHLDLLGVSCLMLARNVVVVKVPDRQRLASSVNELAAALREIAGDPGDRARRQRAVDRALAVSRLLAETDAPHKSALDDAITSAQMVAADIMVFAGVDPKAAHAAVRAGRGKLEVPAQPSTPPIPFGLDQRPPFRWLDRSTTELTNGDAANADERAEQ